MHSSKRRQVFRLGGSGREGPGGRLPAGEVGHRVGYSRSLHRHTRPTCYVTMSHPPAVDRISISIPGSGLNLAADAAGPTNAPTILFLHGGGQTRQSWNSALQEAVRLGYRAISVDLRGHGDSDWSADGRYSLAQFEADIRSVIS